jgi:hypothetical protein
VNPSKKAAATKAELTDAELLAAAGVVVTVTGNHAIDGKAPGCELVDTDLLRLRALVQAGHVTVTVDGQPLTDGAFVARMEGA